MDLKLAFQLVKNMGSRYINYRIKFELEKKFGRLKRNYPVNPIFKNWISIQEWRELPSFLPIFFQTTVLQEEDLLRKSIEKINLGEIKFFNDQWLVVGKDYNWVTNPSNGYQYDVSKHWSEIQDLNEVAGDIKFVWEKSRFSYILTYLQYDSKFNTDSSEFVFGEIENWINANPINQGPNWRCSQEISLRVFNWYRVLCFYKDSKALTEARWEKIQNVIYWSLHHVYHHIDFSRIAVRNNHAITETLFLALSDILFPFIPETKKWSKNGHKWFEEEVAYQIYKDGTFLQFSMNYHRVVVQLLTLGICISEKAKRPFSSVVYDRAHKSLDFLYQCLQEENGWLPNYGANDGALFFPLTNTDYRDYRPQLNSLHVLLTGKPLFDDIKSNEELKWWDFVQSSSKKLPIIERFMGMKEYPIGGYIIFREIDSFTMIRCGNHKDRPVQADNLHIDVWVKGQNILRDSGTYKYNTTTELSKYFTGSSSHNTVVVNEDSQMLKGSRFIWFYWTQKNYSILKETSSTYEFEGEIRAFQFLNKNGRHKRRVVKKKGKNVWIIQDEIFNLDNYTKKQIYHIDHHNIIINAKENEINLLPEKTLSYKSDYYGVKEDGKAIGFKFNHSIITEIKFQQ